MEPIHEISRFADLVLAQRQRFPRAHTAHNVLIAYSTSSGCEAGDGLNGNSVYCDELCKSFAARFDRRARGRAADRPGAELPVETAIEKTRAGLCVTALIKVI